MKKTILLLCSMSILSFSSFAKEEKSAVSANINISNNYIWRGVSQHSDASGKTQSEISLSGGLDYELPYGFAVGVWGSNVSFGLASLEFDSYASYANNYKDFEYELGFINYAYPNATDNDFKEVYVSLSYVGLTAVFYNGLDEAKNNLELSYEFNVLSVDTNLTYGDYTDNNKYQSISFSKNFGDLDWSVGVHRNAPITGDSENNFVFGVGKTF